MCIILVDIDFNKISKTNNQFLTNLQNLYPLLENAESGTFELDGVTIYINSVSIVDTPIVPLNPKFDPNLVEII
jgi:hypothetical protein